MSESGSNPHVRLEAFSDGVFAIAVTLLIIEIKVPPLGSYQTTAELWSQLAHRVPLGCAFALSFLVIFVAWFNHQLALKRLTQTSVHFQYANGFLLFTAAILPFPTALVGETILTDHAQPGVVIYCASCLLHNIAWVAFTTSQVSPRPLCAPADVSFLRLGVKVSWGIFFVFAGVTAMSWFFPMTALVVTALVWIFCAAFGWFGESWAKPQAVAPVAE